MINKFVTKGINISSRTVESFSYIYIENEKRFLKLNEVGSFIWEQINGIKTVKQIVKICLSEYEGSKEEITRAVLEFFDILLKEKIIKISQRKIKEEKNV